MSETETFRTPTTKRFPLVSNRIRRCSAEHMSGIAFRTACIPETHRRRYPIRADRPNQRA